MIDYSNALDICLKAAQTLGVERIPFMQSTGRVLAEDVLSDIDMPPFDKTAVDGYACRRADLTNTLEVLEVIPAGFNPSKTIKEGTCSKIMTGAPIPEGADCVIMVEDVEELDENCIRFVAEKTANNICYLAEDVKKGAVILKKGGLIKPQDIAMFASVGYTEPLVYCQPQVGIISTGNELVEPHEKPGSSKIRNSNAYQLIAQAEAMGGKAIYIGVAEDTEESLSEIINKAMQENDVILLTGGVSMGDFDLVPKMLLEAGFEVGFKSIAVQPGRPTLFGVNGSKYVFGLPGNPVSSFTQFELLVKPFMFKLMDYDFRPERMHLVLAEDYSRKKAARDKWVPAIITNDGEVKATDYHGSAHIHALSYSELMFLVPKGMFELKKGERVHVRYI